MNIELQNITKRYQKKEVLKGVNLSAESGNCIGILGNNGSGKSTLLSILAGVQKSDGGSFLYNGNDLFHYPRQRSQLIGYVPQGTPLIEELHAWDNLSLWYDTATLKRELKDGFLAMLGINEFLKTPVSKMSGGMKKRLSIGCAIAKRPPILLLDEPMSALDIGCKQTILSYLNHHRQKGGIILVATHDVLEMEFCDQWYIMKNGLLNPFQYDGKLETVSREL